MKKMLLKVFCLLFPVGLLIGAVNATADPAALLLRGRDIEELAQYLCDGGVAAGFTNMDERKLQRSIIRLQEEVPSVIAVGSSRIMFVHSRLTADHVGQGSFRNHGMSGGGLYDCIAILGAYAAYAEDLPDTVIIGADPWLFDGYEPGDRFDEMADEIAYLEACIAGETPDMKKSLWGMLKGGTEKLKQLFSLAYFQSSLNYLRANGGIPEKLYYYVESEDATEGALRRADGSMRSSRDEMNISLEDVRAEVSWRVNLKEINRTSYYPDMDQGMQEDFEAFVSYLQSRGVEVIFFLSPFHPAFYRLFQEDEAYGGVIASEAYLLEYARENSISVYGSYDPGLLGMTEESFMDGVHLRDREVENVFSLKR